MSQNIVNMGSLSHKNSLSSAYDVSIQVKKPASDAKKKTIGRTQSATERVQILRCSLWGAGEKNLPRKPRFFG